jgi:predicted lipid-binding transport protein (Tim44 family)
MTLLSKSLESPDASKRASNLLKSIKEKETKKMDEIQKAVAAAEGPLKEQITALQAKLEAFEQVEKAAKAKSRQEALVEAVGEDKAVTLTKGVESLDDESFKTLIDTFKAVKAAQEDILKQGDLMKQVSGQAEDEQEQEHSTVALLKAKYAPK